MREKRNKGERYKGRCLIVTTFGWHHSAAAHLAVVAVAAHIIGHVEGDFTLQFLPFSSIRLPIWILRNGGCCTLRTGG